MLSTQESPVVHLSIPHTALHLTPYSFVLTNIQVWSSEPTKKRLTFLDSPVTLAHPLHFYHLESVASIGCFMKGMCSCPVTLEHELLS